MALVEVKKLRGRSCRAQQAISHRLDRKTHSTRVEIEKIQNELVRVLGANSKRHQKLVREVAHVGGDDRGSVATDRGGEDMAIICVRQLEAVDQWSVPAPRDS